MSLDYNYGKYFKTKIKLFLFQVQYNDLIQLGIVQLEAILNFIKECNLGE